MQIWHPGTVCAGLNLTALYVSSSDYMSVPLRSSGEGNDGAIHFYRETEMALSGPDLDW